MGSAYYNNDIGTVTWVVSLVGFFMVAGMVCHLATFCFQMVRNGKEISKIVFVPAIFSLTLCSLYLLDQSMLILFYKLEKIDLMLWMANDIIHKIAKESMYLFFFAR